MELQQNHTMPIAALPPAQRAMLALNSTTTEEKLREMVQESAEIQEVNDKPGREQAHAAAMKLKNIRVTIEKTGKAARDDANAFSSAVIAEEKRLKAITEAEEKRLLGLRDAYDQRIAAEKAAAEQKERERVASIKVKIEGLRRIPLDLTGQPAAALADELQALQEYQPSAEDFAEFMDEAKAALSAAIESITAMHQRQAAVEDEQARLAAERERLEQDRQAREAEEARLRAEREALEAERRKLEEERAAMRAKIDEVVKPFVAGRPTITPPAVVAIEQPANGLHQIAEPAMPEQVAETVAAGEVSISAGPGFVVEPVQKDTAEGLLREFVALMDSSGDWPYEFDEMDKLEEIAKRARSILN